MNLKECVNELKKKYPWIAKRDAREICREVVRK